MTYENTPLEQKVVSIGAIRDEVEANPSLTESQAAAIEHATDEDIAEALRVNWKGLVEDLFFSAHDQLQMGAVDYLTGLYEERQGL